MTILQNKDTTILDGFFMKMNYCVPKNKNTFETGVPVGMSQWCPYFTGFTVTLFVYFQQSVQRSVRTMQTTVSSKTVLRTLVQVLLRGRVCVLQLYEELFRSSEQRW
jgi:hypothetical protein